MYKNSTRNSKGNGAHRRLVRKLLLTMRLTIFLLTAMILQVKAFTFGQTITLDVKNAPLSTIIHEIHVQSGYDFFYDKALIKKVKRVTLQVQNATIQEVLNACLSEQSLTYKIDNKVVMIKETDPSILEQIKDYFNLPVDVMGHVVDTTGLPLVGATVQVKATGKGIITDLNGDFRLPEVEEGAALEISYIGYRTKEITVTRDNAANLTIILSAVPAFLQEVAVFSTGYQTISKERSAGAYAQADMDIVSNRSTSMSILSRLDGQIPGLTVNNTYNRDPLLIRGASSIGAPLGPNQPGQYFGTSRAPLVVVDGLVMSDVSLINPQDVKEVTVLKDATAASIWGSRAANGVIIITTKRGGSGSNLRVTYDAFVSFQGKPDVDYFHLMNSEQYIQSAKEIFNTTGYQNVYSWANVSTYTSPGTAGVPPHERILYDQSRGIISAETANRRLDSLGRRDNNKQIRDILYRDAALMNHTLSVSGGGKVHSFYLSTAYTNTRSSQPGETDNKYKINLRQDFNVSKALQFFLITDLNQSKASAKRSMLSTFGSNPQFLYPYQLLRDENGNNASMSYVKGLTDELRTDFETRSRISLAYNPLDEFDYGYTKSDDLLARFTGGATVRLFKGLRFEGVYGYNRRQIRTVGFEDLKSYSVRGELVTYTVAPNATTAPIYYMPDKGGKLTNTNAFQTNWTVRNQLIYDNSWNRHQLTLLAGQEAQDQLTSTTATRVRGYDEALQTFGSMDYVTLNSTGILNTVMPNAGPTRSVLIVNDNFATNEEEYRFTSYYANAGYTYDRKYSLNGSWRVDKSTLFGIEKSAQNRPIWSAGVKWILSNENFMRSQAWINSLALRFTYGLTGNAPIPGAASSYDIIATSGNTLFPNNRGAKINTPGNAKLSWESTQTTNFGLDLIVLSGRLSATVDYYRKDTEDLLGLVTTNSLAGYPNVVGNMGDVTNRGVEAALHSLNVQSGDFRWNSSLVLAYNKNEVTRLTSYSTNLLDGNTLVTQSFREKFPAYAVFAYDFAGLDSQGNPQIILQDGTVLTKPSTAIKAEDLRYMGVFQPVWNGGFSNTFRYKNFSLVANTVYSLGHVMRRERYLNLGNFFRTNYSDDFVKRWKKEDDEAFTDIPAYVVDPALNAQRNVNYFTYGDNNVVSASFIKLRDITLMYQVPEFIVSKIRAQGVSFRVQMSNIMLWKANEFGIDPEFQQQVPTNQKTTTLGVHITL